jgi:hypothetical protein
MSGQLRQGDVLLVPVYEMRANASVVEQNQLPGRVVVASGERTGHHHSLAASDAELYRTPFHRYLRVVRPTHLEHEEHGAIAIDPGVYEIFMQHTYTPEKIVPVVD